MNRQARRAHKKTHGVWQWWVIAAAAAVAVLAAVVFISSPKAPTAPMAAATPWVRTVALVHGSSSPQSGDVVHFVDGLAPMQTTSAVVLTDTNCTPDGQGISHCFNKLRLADGHIITVRHDHAMHMVPCLTPGESIRLLPPV